MFPDEGIRGIWQRIQKVSGVAERRMVTGQRVRKSHV